VQRPPQICGVMQGFDLAIVLLELSSDRYQELVGKEEEPDERNYPQNERLRARTDKMKRLIATVAVSLLLMNGLGIAEETAFNNCKLADAKGKQADARLILSDNNKNVVVRVSDRDLVVIPYANIDKFSYEYTKKHRITQGAVVMIASLGAGAVVMLTKSKSHWLYIDYHEQNDLKSVVLRMDKKDYQKILEAIRTHTGKEVELIGEGGKKKAKD